ncbi:hypothetical protein M885DRAFT_611934 [Pelagophyceae sp. CCMP2097]|nr:hypothetical protein M885DRAFT_611934 [Pelagophyceae sp. CCMP2097]
MADAPAAAGRKPCCVCDEPGGKHCTKCKSRHYCSKACQLIDWNEGGHKAQCKQMAAGFQDRLLDELMPAKKVKEAPAIVEDVLLADGSKAAARLSAVPTEKTAVMVTALNGDPLGWRGTCAICLDLPPVDDGQQTFYSCCCKRICAECADKCRQYDERCPLCRAPFPTLPELLRRLQKHADRGNAEAQFQLGDAYSYGILGLEKNPKRARHFYELAAAQGYARAQFRFGTFYQFGYGVKIDYKTAMLGVAQSYDEAVKWYRLAAAQGEPNALFNLGVCYGNGHGVPQDSNEALRWFKRAAAKGHADAPAAVAEAQVEIAAYLAETRPGKKTKLKPELLVNADPPPKISNKKEIEVEDMLRELREIQGKSPRSYCILGTRHCSYLHEQIIELLSYALVLSGNHVYTSGSSGTNAGRRRQAAGGAAASGAAAGGDACCGPQSELTAPPPGLRLLIEKRKAALLRHGWFTSCVRHIRDRAKPREGAETPRFVCYGIGSVFESANAQWQLAFALAARDVCFEGRDVVVEAFDPVSSAIEDTFLQQAFDVTKAPSPEDLVARGAPVDALPDGARRPPDGAEGGLVVLFMPHCPMEVYAAVVGSEVEWRSRLVIVGNSFESYGQRTFSSDVPMDFAAALAAVDEIGCAPAAGDDLDRAFNDNAVMCFPETPAANDAAPDEPTATAGEPAATVAHPPPRPE